MIRRLGSMLVWIVFSATLIAMAGCLVSCSGQRYRYRISERQEQMSQRSALDSTHLSWRSGQVLLQRSHTGQQVLIVPEGPFRYRPDSGFNGRAAYVLLQSRTEKVSYRSDSASGAVVHTDRLDSLDGTIRHTASDQRESRYQTGLRIPVWIWLIILAGAGWMIRQIWKTVRE